MLLVLSSSSNSKSISLILASRSEWRSFYCLLGTPWAWDMLNFAKSFWFGAALWPQRLFSFILRKPPPWYVCLIPGALLFLTLLSATFPTAMTLYAFWKPPAYVTWDAYSILLLCIPLGVLAMNISLESLILFVSLARYLLISNWFRFLCSLSMSSSNVEILYI